MSEHEITVVIPTIPPRSHLLERAWNSVQQQVLRPEAIVVVTDHYGQGAAQNRNTGLESVTTDLVAFLDDDDQWYPNHLELLLETMISEDADLVYPQYCGINEGLFAEFAGRPFDHFSEWTLRNKRNFIPVTVLVKTELIRKVGGFSKHPQADDSMPLEDWGCWVKLLDAGAKFAHCPHITWQWNRSKHTSGRPWNQVYL